MATWFFAPAPAPAPAAPAPAAAPAAKGKVRKDIMNGRLEKRSGDGSWKAHGFYVHSTVLCYYLEDQDDKIENGPHASLNLLSVERVDAKTKDDKKVVRLWIDEKKKVELRQAPVVDGKDEASIDKWEAAFMAFVEQARTNGARRKYLDSLKPKSRVRRMSDTIEKAVFGEVADPQAKADAQAKDQIVAFYKEHNPAKLADVDGLIAKYKSAGVDVATLFEAIKKKYDAAK